MSRHGDVTLEWGDGTYVFRLALGQLRELEEKQKIGVPSIYKRILMREWKVDDLREILRLGLIGGGQVSPVAALKLMERYFDDRPLVEAIDPALRILGAALLGDEDDRPKKKEQEQPSEKTTMSDSTFHSSTETGPSWDSRLQ